MSEPKPRPAGPAPQARLPIAVVGGALFGITQHFIRLGDLLELLLGRFVTVVAVGVVGHGELAVGLLDVGLRGFPRNAQHRVEVARAHCSSSPTSRLV